MVVRANVEHKEYEDGLKGLFDRLKGLQRRHIYVGIPQAEDSRKDGTIGNAELLYIHTHGIRRRPMIREMDRNMARGMKYSAAFSLYLQSHGSPLWHAPPRPVLEPALKANREKIGAEFKKIYEAAAQNNDAAMENAITRTGMAAQNVCREWFTDPRNGWASNSPVTIRMKKSENPLIDTGSMRKAITYVVRSD